tara:strand:+ start:6011 stop:6652 length:642 start_codon:yes stop_codon:yes gene_type:complete
LTNPEEIFAGRLSVMARMQAAHNDEVHPDWRNQGFEYYRAVWVECAELLDHFGWKWWKKQVADIEQVKLEIVDIWHFGLSDLIRDDLVGTDLAHEMFQRAANKSDGKFRQAVETLAARALVDPKFHVASFIDVLNALPMSLDELFEKYIGKNVLNRFRQAHGYKAGSYQKVWQGREDNVHLSELLVELNPLSDSFVEELLDALERRYPDKSSS